MVLIDKEFILEDFKEEEADIVYIENILDIESIQEVEKYLTNLLLERL